MHFKENHYYRCGKGGNDADVDVDVKLKAEETTDVKTRDSRRAAEG